MVGRSVPQAVGKEDQREGNCNSADLSYGSDRDVRESSEPPCHQRGKSLREQEHEEKRREEKTKTKMQ